MGATLDADTQSGIILFHLFPLSISLFHLSYVTVPPQNAGNDLATILLSIEKLVSEIDLNGIALGVVQMGSMTRAMVVVPLLRIAIFLCLVMTLMILAEKICFGMVSLVVKIFRLKPEKRYRWEPMQPDLELGTLAYPKVLIQIPMFNEKEVIKSIISISISFFSSFVTVTGVDT